MSQGLKGIQSLSECLSVPDSLSVRRIALPCYVVRVIRVRKFFLLLDAQLRFTLSCHVTAL